MTINDPAKAELQRMMRIAALAVLFFSLEDWVILGRFLSAALAVRLAWAAALVGLSLVVPRLDARGRDGLLAIACSLSVGFFSGVVQLTGGMHGMNVLWVACLPLAVTLLSSGQPRPALASCLATLLATPVLVWADHGDGRALIAALGEVFAACVIACYAVVYFERLRAVEREELQRRIDMAEQLALSEESRLKSEPLALIGRVASGVADELTDHLSYISSNVEFVKRLKAQGQRLSPADYDRLLTETSHGLDRVNQLVRDLWSLSREADYAEVCPVTEVLDDALRLASFRLRHVGRIEKQIAHGLPAVRGNPKRLTQVLVNLLVNAADSLSELRGGHGGCVRVAVQMLDGAQVEILVEDDAPGRATAAPHRSVSGDLALSLSREYVERFGGQIVASLPEEGRARFAVRLPIGAVPAAQA